VANIPMTFACGLYDRMVALATREIQPEGIDLNFIIEDAPRKIFDRMAGSEAFDACEMSLSEVITRVDADKSPFVAIPIFPSRVFRHGFIVVNRNAIRTPKDLEGKRIGIPIYTVTAAVYIRALLQHEYGVDLSTIQWVTGDMEKPGTHGNPSIMPLLTPVSIEHNHTDKSLGDLLAENSLQAMIGATMPSVLGRHPDVARLFPNYVEVEADYYRRTQIFPIMHVVVIRKEVYERNPFVAASLYRALCASKDLALTRMRSVGALYDMLPWLWQNIADVDKVFGEDPWPYGLEANRKTLTAFITYLAEQGMISKPMPLENVFVPVE
jgi:4,5-dihydroxyphthalate decarboxylase